MASFTCVNCGDKNVTITIKDTSADPHPYGFFGFGLTTVLLNIHNTGFFPMDSMIIGMAIMFGGLCQIMGGIMCYLKGMYLPAIAFASFGYFWISFGLLQLFAANGIMKAPSAKSLAWYMTIWGVYVIIFFVYTIYFAPIFIQYLFATVFVLFFLLAFGIGLGSTTVVRIAGWEGIICGLSAMYAGAASLLNTPERTLLPMGKNYCCGKKKKPNPPKEDSTENIKGAIETSKGQH